MERRSRRWGTAPGQETLPVEGNASKTSEFSPFCRNQTGFIYVGPLSGEDDYTGQICPWGIADGRAAEELGVTFHDEEAVGGYGKWDVPPQQVVEEIVRRTPGFSGWQQEQWWTHCNDAAKFLGRVGRKELDQLGPEPAEEIRKISGISPEQWQRIYPRLSKDSPPSAYVFQCAHCGKYGGYFDTD